MADRKRREEVPRDIAADVLFMARNTCCVCRESRRRLQLHHIDGDPSNNDRDNLAVLCLICHDETQIRGGFGRRLDATQIKLYRDGWNEDVRAEREFGSITHFDGPAPGVLIDQCVDGVVDGLDAQGYETALIVRHSENVQVRRVRIRAPGPPSA